MTQFVEKDAEDIGRLCGEIVENIIHEFPPDVTKISPIAKAAKYAQDNKIDFDDAYKFIINNGGTSAKLDIYEQRAVQQIVDYFSNKYPDAMVEAFQDVVKYAVAEMRKPECANMNYWDFVNYFISRYD